MPITFSGIWRPGGGLHVLFVDGDLPHFVQKYQELTAQGMRLGSFRTYRRNGLQLWSGIWRQGGGLHELLIDADFPSFRAKYQSLASQGMRLRAFEVSESAGDPRWAGVWEPATGLHQLHVDADWTNFKAKYQELAAQGMRLAAFRTYRRGSLRLWSGAWRAGDGAQFLHVDADLANFLAVNQQQVAQGSGLIALASYVKDGVPVFAGAWRQAAPAPHLELNRTWEDFKARYEALTQQGLRLENLDVSGTDAVKTLRMHFKILENPQIPLATMLGKMREVFSTAGIDVEVGSVQRLDISHLRDLDVGLCVAGQTTAEQKQLFLNRDGVAAQEVAVYLVRSTLPPLNGCAAHGQLPAAVVVSLATRWTLAHEVGHVLRLDHVDNNTRLMTGNGTANIIEPPRLIEFEVTRMLASPFLS